MGMAKSRRELQRLERMRRKAKERPERDDVFGIRLSESPESRTWRGRVEWKVDREPYFALMALARLLEHLEGFEDVLVEELRAEDIPWDDIGFALGVSGEAVRKRHSRGGAA